MKSAKLKIRRESHRIQEKRLTLKPPWPDFRPLAENPYPAKRPPANPG